MVYPHSCIFNEYIGIVNRVQFKRRVWPINDKVIPALRSLVNSSTERIRKGVRPISMDCSLTYSTLYCKGALRTRNLNALNALDGVAPHGRHFDVYEFAKTDGQRVDLCQAVLAPSYDYPTDNGSGFPVIMKDPRAIQAMELEGNLEWARIIRPLEARFYSMINLASLLPTPPGGVCHGKGMDSYATARMLREVYDQFEQPVIVAVDATRADAHEGEMLHRFKFDLYEAFLDDAAIQHLRKLTPAYMNPRSKSLHGLRYTAPTTLRSGFMDTALANNCIFHLLHGAMRDFIQGGETYRQLGADVDPTFAPFPLASHDYTVVINGDDANPFVEHSTYDKIKHLFEPFFRQFGVDLRVESIATTFEHIEWCQARPIEYLPGRYKMVRNVNKVLSSATAGIKWCPWEIPQEASVFDLSPKALSFIHTRLQNVSVGEKMLNVGVPMLQAYFSHLYSLVDHDRVRKGDYLRGEGLAYRLTHEARVFGGKVKYLEDYPISDTARRSFERAFGISAHEQVKFEKYVKTLTLPTQCDVSHVSPFPHVWDGKYYDDAMTCSPTDDYDPLE